MFVYLHALRQGANSPTYRRVDVRLEFFPRRRRIGQRITLPSSLLRHASHGIALTQLGLLVLFRQRPALSNRILCARVRHVTRSTSAFSCLSCLFIRDTVF